MIRSLVIIAVTGLIMSVVCLSAAIAIGGPDFLAHGGWWRTSHGWRFESRGDGWRNNLSLGDPDETQVTRTQAWTGGEQLVVEVPADVRFTQAPGPASITIRGPRSAVDHLVVEGGRIRFDGPVDDTEDLTIEITAPKVTQFTLAGSGDLQIRDYRQDSLSLNLSGSGDVAAQGAAKTVATVISGSSDADLSQLAADGADVRISGSGSATVGPKSWAKLDISGSGDINLTSRPPRLESHVTGSGEVEQAAPTILRTPAAGPARPA